VVSVKGAGEFALYQFDNSNGATLLDFSTAALTLMATSNSPTCGHSNSPRQDGRIMGFS